MLSQTAEYALRAVLFLADREGDAPVRVGDMARALSLPQNYLSKTLHALVRTGVLTSVRGPAGGFLLARTPKAIPLVDVVAPFDHFSDRRQCLLGRAECSDRRSCAAHESWKATSDQIATFFRTTTVADLVGSPAAAVTSKPRTAR